MNVLKKATPVSRSISPAKAKTQTLVVQDRASSSSNSSLNTNAQPRESGNSDRPPLPARRKSAASKPVSVASSTSSRMSMDEIASASVTKSKSSHNSNNPFGSLNPSLDSPVSARSAPPTHPDRKTPSVSEANSNSASNTGYKPPTPTSPVYPNSQSRGVFRSKSLHQSSPPPIPPPRKRRPESVSVQLTPTASTESSPFFTPNAVQQHLAQLEQRDRASSTGTPTPAFPSLSRQLSSPSRRRDSASVNAPTSPMAHLQRTLTSLQPKLEAARYKAEAGFSKKGYVHHPHRSPWVEEGEEGLMPASRAKKELGIDWQTDEEGDGGGIDSSFGDEEPGQDSIARGRSGEQWPVGEGYKPL